MSVPPDPALPLRRARRPALVLAAAIAALGVVACDDPLARLDGTPQALVGGDEGGDGVISLGEGYAARLYYQFVDASGQVRFVERLEDVPEEWRSRVGYVELDSAPPLSPGMARETRDRRYQQVANRSGGGAAAARVDRVVLYSADWCGFCRKAKRHLDRKGIDYEVRDIDHPENLQELVVKTGQKGIPVLDVGGRVVTGFSPTQYDALLGG